MKTQEKATEALKYFVKDKRNNGDEFWKAESAPQWITDMCHDAHGDMLPDDWKYDFIVEALNALADCDNDDEVNLESDVYTSDLLKWLASHLDRIGYCDQAVRDGLSEGNIAADGIVCAISWGQYVEKNEVLASVRQSLEKQITE